MYSFNGEAFLEAKCRIGGAGDDGLAFSGTGISRNDNLCPKVCLLTPLSLLIT
jgi:hypothetical protein